MPYATPQRFVQEYGPPESSQLLADAEGLVTRELLEMALAGTLPSVPVTGPDPITQPELDAMAAAMARLTRKLSDMSNFMDGYLRSVVTLPLPESHASAGVLEECCVVLTRVSLASSADSATERMDNLDKQWRGWLRDVQSRKVQLVDSVTGQGPQVSNSIRSGRIKSGIDRGLRAGFCRDWSDL